MRRIRIRSSVLPNSGHLRVTVTPTQVTVDYVKAFLSGAGTNGQIAYTYSIPAPATPGSIVVSSLSLNPSTVVGGGASSTATVTLNGPAPSDVSVTLTNSNPSAATVQSAVTVPANSTSATFTVTSQTVASSATSVITATLNGSAQATLTVNPAATGLDVFDIEPDQRRGWRCQLDGHGYPQRVPTFGRNGRNVVEQQLLRGDGARPA